MRGGTHSKQVMPISEGDVSDIALLVYQARDYPSGSLDIMVSSR